MSWGVLFGLNQLHKPCEILGSMTIFTITVSDKLIVYSWYVANIFWTHALLLECLHFYYSSYLLGVMPNLLFVNIVRKLGLRYKKRVVPFNWKFIWTVVLKGRRLLDNQLWKVLKRCLILILHIQGCLILSILSFLNIKPKNEHYKINFKNF